METIGPSGASTNYFDSRSNGVSEVIETLRQDPETPQEYKRQIDDIEQHITSYFDKVGGLDQSPRLDDPDIYVFGDIHARDKSLADAIEKIKKVYQANGKNLHEELADGRVVFAFVGDIVHSERNKGNYQEGKTVEDRKKVIQENLNSILGVTKLKLLYPKSVFVVKGNHDDAAVKPKEVEKFGLDQGESLYNALNRHGLVKPVSNILTKLPIVAGIHSKTGQHLIVSHALPIGDYSELLTRFGRAKNNTPNVINLKAVEAIDTTQSQDYLLNLLKNSNSSTTQLFTWSKIKEPFSSPGANLPIGVDVVGDEKIRQEQLNKAIYLYLDRLMSKTFGKTRGGEEISTRDMLWIIGHEDRYGISRNVAGWFNQKNPSKLKIYQLNDQHDLPVVKFKFSELTNSKNVTSSLQEATRKFSS